MAESRQAGRGSAARQFHHVLWNAIRFSIAARICSNRFDICGECQVAVAIAKMRFNVAVRAAAAIAMAGTDWCQSSRINYGIAAPAPSDSIALVSGDRRTVMQVGRQQKQFKVPLADRSWPDDTLIEFQPSAPVSLADYTAHQLYLRGTMNKWGTSLPFRQIDMANFRAEAELPAGISKFKIASADSRMVDIGPA
jgi:hypothetical protein